MVFKTELTIVVEDGVVQNVEGLPSGWTFQVDDNNVSGFEVGIYKKEKTDETIQHSSRRSSHSQRSKLSKR